jgi:methyl-accepting chemotaxis protein
MSSRFNNLLIPGIDDPGLSFRVKKQLPYVALSLFLLLIAFILMLPVSLMSSKGKANLFTASTAILIGAMLYALVLLRKAKYRGASLLSTVALFLISQAVLFLMPYTGAPSQAYRPFAFMAVMSVCNALVALDRRQVLLFSLGVLASWLAGFATIFRHFFASDASEIAAIFLIGLLGLAISGTVLLSLRRLSDQLLANAEEQACRAEGALKNLRGMLQDAREGMEIGDRILSASGKVEESLESVRTILGHLIAGSDSLVRESDEFGSSSQRVLASANAMKGSMDEQNSAISETSAAITEISASLSHVSGIASKRRAMLDDVSAGGGLQRELLGKLLAAVSSVRESSEGIGAVVHTVQDIASRTSLLSMNASIEAARAGSSGKGFSVISQEIRALSEETQRNAATINELLGRNTQSVASATDMMRAFSEFIERSGLETKQLIESIDEILRGIEEMDAGTREVVQAVQDIVGSSQAASGIVGEVVGQVDGQRLGFDRIAAFLAELRGRVGSLEAAVAEIDSASVRVADAGRLNNEQVRKLQRRVGGAA